MRLNTKYRQMFIFWRDILNTFSNVVLMCLSFHINLKDFPVLQCSWSVFFALFGNSPSFVFWLAFYSRSLQTRILFPKVLCNYGGHVLYSSKSAVSIWDSKLGAGNVKKIMASGPVTTWEIDGETVATVSDFIFWGSKITADLYIELTINSCRFFISGGSKITVDGDCSH